MTGALRTCTTAVLLLLVTACGGDELLLPSEGQPAEITPVGPEQRQGRVGETLPDPIQVRVTDTQGRPVAGVQVAFVVVSGPAPSLDPQTAVTDGNGRAGTRVTLPAATGQAIVEARVAGGGQIGTLIAEFTLGIVPADAATLEKAGGDAQIGTVGDELPVPLAVRVVDGFGNGVPGITVAWTAEGGGTVSAATTTTGADGVTSVVRRLGSRPGAYTTTARADGLAGSPVVFTSTASTGPSPRLVLATPPSETARSGVVLERQPVVQLQDAQGQPIAQAGVVVSVQVAAGGGGLTGTTARPTDASGLAAFTDLAIIGPAGTRTLIFAAENFAAVSSGPIVVEAGQPASIAVHAGDNQQAAVGATLPVDPAVRVLDAASIPVPGITVTFEVISGGGSVTGAQATTDQNGVAAVGSWRLGNTAGEQRLRASIAGSGIAGNPVTFRATATAAAPDAGESSVEVEPTSITAGGQPATVRVTVRDAFGNPVSGASVELSASGDGNTITQPASPTDAQGRTTGQFTSTAAGSHTITARVGSVTLADRPAVVVTPAAPSAERSSASVAAGTAGSPTAITVTVRDAFGNAVSGAASAIAVAVESGPNAGAEVSSATDEGGGRYTVTYTPRIVGTDGVVVRVGGQPVSGSPFSSEVGAGPPAAETTTAQVSPGFCLTERAIVAVVTTRDAFGNRVTTGGAAITVTASVGGGSEVQHPVTDNGDGTYRSAITVNGLSRVTVRIRLNGTQIQGSPFVSDPRLC